MADPAALEPETAGGWLERTGLGRPVPVAKQVGEVAGYHYVLFDCPPALGELTTWPRFHRAGPGSVTQIRPETLAQIEWVQAQGAALTDLADAALTAYLDAARIPHPAQTARCPTLPGNQLHNLKIAAVDPPTGS
jgi:hypothetical protein